jgi:hypothetical protein
MLLRRKAGQTVLALFACKVHLVVNSACTTPNKVVLQSTVHEIERHPIRLQSVDFVLIRDLKVKVTPSTARGGGAKPTYHWQASESYKETPVFNAKES